MEYRKDVVFCKMLDKSLSLIDVLTLDVEHVSIVYALFGNVRKRDLLFVSKFGKSLVVMIPACASVVVDLVGYFKLLIKVCCIHVTGKV